MFENDFRVRYSDCDSMGETDLLTIVKYLEDVATDHSTSAGNTLEYQVKMCYFWAVTGWDIDVRRYPKYYEEIKAKTFINVFDKFVVQRGFEICDSEDNVIVTATSNWIICDRIKHRMKKVPDEVMERTKLDLYVPHPLMPFSFREKFETAEIDTITVGAGDIDTNDHMNNVSYIRYALMYCEKGEKPLRVSVYYKKACYLGEKITVNKAIEDGRTVITFTADDEVRFICIFK